MIRITWHFLKQLGALLVDVLTIALALAGICLMVKYLGRMLILTVPLLVLLVGVVLYAWTRVRGRMRRRQDGPDEKQGERLPPRR